ncbi:MAG: ThuA domain-containing protein [Planctomycetota bacterium]
MSLKRNVSILASLLLVLGVSVTASAHEADKKKKPRPPAPPKARILIVTGADVPAHDWRATTKVTRKILEEDRELDVRVCEDTAILETSALHSYDVVLLNFRNNPRRDPGPKARDNLAKFVREGKGLIAVHFAIYAFAGWEEYQKILGRVWVGRQSGKKISGHGPRKKLPIEIQKPEHPILKGMKSVNAVDELAAKLVGDEKIEVLMSAKSEYSGQVEPVAWTRAYGKGRVFVTVLGHDAEARSQPDFGSVLRRATRWAAAK